MKIHVELIDTQGFIHFKQGKSKKLVKQWLAQLKEGTQITWRNEASVFVSQQYLPR